jgi:hypothetical protein
MIIIYVRRSIKNFKLNSTIVSKVVIDNPNRYKLHPTSRTISFLNVITDKIPLINPTTIKIIVNTKLTFISTIKKIDIATIRFLNR